MVALIEKLDNIPKTAHRARGATSSTSAPVQLRSNSLSRIEFRVYTYDNRRRLESCSRDPIGYADGLCLYANRFFATFLDPNGTQRTYQQAVLCEALEEKIKSFLNTPEERLFFDHFSDYPQTHNGRQADMRLSAAVTENILAGANAIPSCDPNPCLGGDRTGSFPPTSFHAARPWVLALGNFTRTVNFTCTTCGHELEACVSDTYDFDVKGFLNTHRTFPAEFKTMLIHYSGGVLGCGWAPFGISGCMDRISCEH